MFDIFCVCSFCVGLEYQKLSKLLNKLRRCILFYCHYLRIMKQKQAMKNLKECQVFWNITRKKLRDHQHNKQSVSESSAGLGKFKTPKASVGSKDYQKTLIKAYNSSLQRTKTLKNTRNKTKHFLSPDVPICQRSKPISCPKLLRKRNLNPIPVPIPNHNQHPSKNPQKFKIKSKTKPRRNHLLRDRKKEAKNSKNT